MCPIVAAVIVGIAGTACDCEEVFGAVAGGGTAAGGSTAGNWAAGDLAAGIGSCIRRRKNEPGRGASELSVRRANGATATARRAWRFAGKSPKLFRQFHFHRIPHHPFHRLLSIRHPRARFATIGRFCWEVQYCLLFWCCSVRLYYFLG
jgi:hypothetical protein